MNDNYKDNLIFKIFPSFTHPYLLLIRIDKPIGFLLLFYPTSFSLLSFGKIDLSTLNYLILFFVGSFVMRSAGCIVNDIFDKNIDKKVDRTKYRPLATKQISLNKSIFFLVILLIIGILVLTKLNTPSIILGLVVAPLIILYPIAKRLFLFPQLVLAMTYNWGCLIGWSTINAPYEFKKIIILYLSLIIWTVIYDTIYATQDEEDDRKMNLYSSVILFDKKRLFILTLLISLQYSLLLFFGYLLNYHLLFYLAIVLVFIVNLIDIHLKWKNLPSNSMGYFKRNNYYGILILLSIMIGSHFNV